MKLVLNVFVAIAALLGAAGAAQAQGLQRGNLLGLHVMSVKLRSNVTVEDFEKFYVEQVLPEYEKNWPGLKGYLLQNFRDEAKNQFAIVWLFETTEARNRYFDEAGTPNERANELERAALAKVKPIEDKLKKLYGEYTVRYTNEDDWVVQ